MRISKFDQEFIGKQPFAIIMKGYDREDGPTAKIALPRYCIKNLSDSTGTLEQISYFAQNRTRILLGDDPDWRLAAVEVLEDSSLVLRYYIVSSSEQRAVRLDSRHGFYLELKVSPQGASVVTETYSISLDSRRILPRPHLMILYGYQCKAALAEIRDERSALVPATIGCMA